MQADNTADNKAIVKQLLNQFQKAVEMFKTISYQLDVLQEIIEAQETNTEPEFSESSTLCSDTEDSIVVEDADKQLSRKKRKRENSVESDEDESLEEPGSSNCSVTNTSAVLRCSRMKKRMRLLKDDSSASELSDDDNPRV